MGTRYGRLTAALLAAALALGLAGCKKDGKSGAENLVFQYAPNYIAEDVPLPVDAGQLEGSCTDGKSIWFMVTPERGAPPALCRTPLDGGEAEVLADYRLPETDEDTSLGYLGPVLGGDGKLWVWEQRLKPEYELPEGFNPETDDKGEYAAGLAETWRMRQLDPASGRELSAVDVTAVIEQLDGMRLTGMAVDKKGFIYLADSEKVTVSDPQGQLLFTLEAELSGGMLSGSAGSSLALLPDGSAAALTGFSVRPIDPKARDWSETEYRMSGGDRIYSGQGDCQVYYIRDEVLYGVVEGSELPQRLLPWSNARLDNPGSVMCFALLEEGRAAILTCTHESSADAFAGQLRAMLLSPTDEVPEDGRVRLELGMIGDDPGGVLRYRIKQFNRQNEDYFIELRDYAEGMLNAAGDYNQAYQNAVTRLFAEIAAGRGPDIFDESLPLDALARQGALEDLWPWIDSDPDLGREKVMERVLTCMETEGKLYRICGGFAIETAVASAEVAGDRTGWTMEEMLESFGGEMPELYIGSTDSFGTAANFARFDKKSLLRALADTNLDRYVDWETGECAFDGEDFKSLLELCGSAREADESKLAVGKERWYHGFGDGAAESLEVCQVFPWDGAPIFYSRTLASAQDLLVDDVLFGGQEALWDYERQLWDAGILYTWISPYNGRELINTYAEIPAFGYMGDIEVLKKYGIPYLKGGFPQVAADAVSGAMNGRVFASYVGFPTQSGTGSSFTVYDSMGISASCEAREGAWDFIRYLLLPGGNQHYYTADGITNVSSYCFPINREEFERTFLPEPQWCVHPGTEEYYLDSSGNRVEKSMDSMAIGDPAVMLVYQLAASQEQRDRFWKLYNSVEHISGGDAELLDLIIEQAQPYFAGDKGLDETAELVQRRAQLYVHEHR